MADVPAPLALMEMSVSIVQPCATKFIANVVKTIYHALTCSNALVVKMKVKIKITNLTKTMNTVPPRKTASKIYLLFVCFIILHFGQVLTVLVEIKITCIKELVSFLKIPYYYYCVNIY